MGLPLALAGVVVAAMLLPTAWLILATAVGVLVAKAGNGYLFRRHAYATLRQVCAGVVAAAAVAFALRLPSAWADPGVLLGQRRGYGTALLVALTAFAVMAQVIAAAGARAITVRRWTRILRWDVGGRLLGYLAVGCGVLLVAVLLSVHPRMMLVVPLALLVLYLAYRFRRHVRSERRAWVRLAAATEELSGSSELSRLLHVAGRAAVSVFGVRCVDVEIWGSGPPRLVRVGTAGVVFDGAPGKVAVADSNVAWCAIAGGGASPIGAIRLYLGTEDRLSGGQRSMLRTLGGALASAVANVDTVHSLKAIAHRAEVQALRDPLTGLPNRRGLLALLDRHLSQARPGQPAAAILDLDHFKQVNDNLGHAVGDLLLIDVARRLGRVATIQEATVARLAGDEFAILFAAPAGGAAVARADAIVSCLDEPFDVHGMSIVVRGSTGVAVAEPGMTGEELLRRADLTMYRAKRGRTAVGLYHRRHDRGAGHRRSLSGDLRRAVAAEEITVRFQPVVHLAGGEVVACEAFAGWQHPEHGLLDPSAWLDVVEHAAELAIVTEYVMDRALAGAAAWRSVVELPVMVNVSQRCLLDVRFAHLVRSRLEIHGLEPRHLVIELTETGGISALDVVRTTLRGLRSAGVRIVVDQFGGSPSSLPMLTQMPALDGLKIDPAVVGELGGATDAEVVVRAANRLASNLRFDLSVGVEGVRTHEQRQALWSLGCATGQGSLFAEPMTLRETVDLLRFSPRIASPLPQRDADVR